tara:strand:- start:619 stop:936 length:318 start_codon:yes stop_codon:yes gene_type:complete
MKKFFITFFILFLILFTALVKNSTKKIEDEIFNARENIRDLKKELGDTKLEFDYLSSAEKLLEFQLMYFEKNLVKKELDVIKILEKKSKEIIIKNYEITKKNVKK